jgi:hypothetical protein
MNYQRVILLGRMRCDDNQAKTFEGAFNEFFSLRSMPLGEALVIPHGSRFEHGVDAELKFLVDAEIKETTTPITSALEQQLAKELREALFELAQSHALFVATRAEVDTLTFEIVYASPWLFGLESQDAGARNVTSAN